MSTDEVPVNFTCLKCGSAKIVVSNGYADDSMTSCGDCGQEFGLWPEVKAHAVKAAKEQFMSKLKGSFGPGWKWN